METNKGDVESIYARVTTPASKTLKLNWINFWLDFFDCIQEQLVLFDTNTNVIAGFMISLFQHLLQEYEEHETLWEHHYRMG